MSATVAPEEFALERIERLCRSAVDTRALRLAVLDEIGRIVRFDAYVWPLTDPVTEVGTAPLARVPFLPQLPTLIRLRYLSRVNRWTQLGGAATAHLSDLPGSTDDWVGFMLEGGMKDVASAPFRDRYGLWGWLDLWRSSGDPFTSRELRWLDRVASVVTTALRAGLAATFMKPAARTPSGPLVLMLTPELQVTDTTPRTHEYLEQLVPPAPGRDAIPANAYNVAAQLIAVERDVDDHPPRARTHLAEGLWVSVGAARLGPPEQGERPIVVTIEACTGADRADVFARVHGLSERESELLSILASGPDTRDAARGMSISEHTVQDHLKSIFAKTSTRTRSALLARATAS